MTSMDYKNFNSLDAQPILWDALNKFFSEHKHRFKFGDAYQDYRKNIVKNPFTASKRLFEVMTGTSLVRDKLIQINKTQRGVFYMIKRTHIANIDRDKRTQQRNDESNNITSLQKQPATMKSNDTQTSRDNNQYASLDSEDDDSTTINLMVPETVESAIQHHGIMDDADEDNDGPVPTNVEGISQSILD